MSQMQIALWLQCLLLFSVVWGIGGTMNGDSRTKFDVYFRNLISGTDQDHPRPKTFKLGKVRHGAVSLYNCCITTTTRPTYSLRGALCLTTSSKNAEGLGAAGKNVLIRPRL